MNNKGFTLLEIIIAVAIFAIIASISSAILLQIMRTKELSQAQINIINNLQLSIALLQRDCQQITNRPIRGNQMHLFPAFIGEKKYLEFTRGGDININSAEQRSTLLRVAYICKKNQLIRRLWSELDSPERNNYFDSILLDNLTSCKFAYVGMHQNIMPSWYQYTTTKNNKNVSSPLPEAIQVQLALANQGDIKLQIIL